MFTTIILTLLFKILQSKRKFGNTGTTVGGLPIHPDNKRPVISKLFLHLNNSHLLCF